MNNLKVYWKYFKYVVEHKKNVFIEAIKMGMPIHAITHDLSKFFPSEFISYALYFYANDRTKKYSVNVDETQRKDLFRKGWALHQKRNKHHNTYWTAIINGKIEIIEMPDKYLRQMVCDWKAMSRKFGGTAKQYYCENERENIIIHPVSKIKLEKILRVN